MSNRKSKKRMAADERKVQIVKVAMTLFAKNGFKGTTTREIARQAGISEAVIFKYFSKKEGLYNAIIDARCNDTQGQDRLMNALSGKEGREVFGAVASFLISEHRNDPSFMRLLTFSALEKHDLSEIFIKRKGLELIEFLEGHIKGLVEEGVFKNVDPAIAARAFMGMVLHYCISQELYRMKRYFKRPDSLVVNTFVDIFFDGMRRR